MDKFTFLPPMPSTSRLNAHKKLRGLSITCLYCYHKYRHSVVTTFYLYIEMENSDKKVSSAQADRESTHMEIEEDDDDIKDSKSFCEEDVDMEDVDKEVSSVEDKVVEEVDSDNDTTSPQPQKDSITQDDKDKKWRVYHYLIVLPNIYHPNTMLKKLIELPMIFIIIQNTKHVEFQRWQ